MTDQTLLRISLGGFSVIVEAEWLPPLGTSVIISESDVHNCAVAGDFTNEYMDCLKAACAKEWKVVRYHLDLRPRLRGPIYSSLSVICEEA